MPDEECAPDQLDVDFIGGDFSTGESASDTPMLRFGYQRVNGKAARARAARVSIDATVGPEGRVEGQETFSREALGLRGFDDVIAIIDGIAFDTNVAQPDSYPDDYDPAHGYTMRGFGAGVEVDSAEGDDIVVDWHLVFDAANSPDRASHNRAVAHARVGGTLDILLLGTDAPVTRESHAYSQSHPDPEPLSDEVPPHPDEETQRFTVTGAAGKPLGIYGLGSFEFGLTIAGTCDNCSVVDSCGEDGFCTNAGPEPGEYLREIAVAVTLDTYDEDSGEAVFLVDGYLSGASTFIANYAMEYNFTADVVWAQIPVDVEAQRLEETFETGSATFDLP